MLQAGLVKALPRVDRATAESLRAQHAAGEAAASEESVNPGDSDDSHAAESHANSSDDDANDWGVSSSAVSASIGSRSAASKKAVRVSILSRGLASAESGWRATSLRSGISRGVSSLSATETDSVESSCSEPHTVSITDASESRGVADGTIGLLPHPSDGAYDGGSSNSGDDSEVQPGVEGISGAGPGVTSGAEENVELSLSEPANGRDDAAFNSRADDNYDTTSSGMSDDDDRDGAPEADATPTDEDSTPFIQPQKPKAPSPQSALDSLLPSLASPEFSDPGSMLGASPPPQRVVRLPPPTGPMQKLFRVLKWLPQRGVAAATRQSLVLVPGKASNGSKLLLRNSQGEAMIIARMHISRLGSWIPHVYCQLSCAVNEFCQRFYFSQVILVSYPEDNLAVSHLLRATLNISVSGLYTGTSISGRLLSYQQLS